MKSRLRTVIFWIHLATGVTVGLIVAVMALTGGALALQPQVLEWAESPSRVIPPPPAGARPLPLSVLVEKARAASPGKPGAAPSSLTVHSDPASAVRLSSGRGGWHVNPYTGETRPLAGQGWRDFFQVSVEWHRYLGTSGEGRNIGKAITGAANAGFLFLAISGLYLWWPRKWSERALRLSFWFRRGLGAKTRDWNWHNVIGFWSLPVLIVITFSGLMISYRPVTNLIYRVAGETPPGPGAAPVAPPLKVSPPAGATNVAMPPLDVAGLTASVSRARPDWKSYTVRLPSGGKGGPQPVVLSVKEHGQWPMFGAAQLSLDPWTGQVLRTEGFAEYTTGRKIRTWLRFLHTGEALGVPGQLLAGVVSLGASLLVWTGLALALRRLKLKTRFTIYRSRQHGKDEADEPILPEGVERPGPGAGVDLGLRG